MRARNIKPGFFKNDELGEISPVGRILFAGLWCMADREGRLERRAKRIKAEILPYDNEDVEDILQQLEQRGFLLPYSAGGKDYIQVINWHKHQSPHHLEGGSEIPPPQGAENKFNDSPISAAQRNRILNRDGRKCAECGSKKELHIDHILPRSKGGDSRDSNLQVLCKACNLKKGACTKRARSMQGSCTDLTQSLIPDSLIPDSLIPDSKDTCSETSKPNVADHVVEDSSPVFIWLPTNTKEKYPVTVAQAEAWSDLYGNIDVGQQLKKMLAWLDARPGNERKTMRGMKKFVVGWLNRAQDDPKNRNMKAGSNGNGKAEARRREWDALPDQMKTEYAGQYAAILNQAERNTYGVQ